MQKSTARTRPSLRHQAFLSPAAGVSAQAALQLRDFALEALGARINVAQSAEMRAEDRAQLVDRVVGHGSGTFCRAGGRCRGRVARA